MAMLTRKISRAKWEASDDLNEGEIQADAVSADLRTSGNTLSFWRCASSDDAALRRAVLALAAAAERVDRIDVAWLTVASVDDNGIAHKDTPGNTPVTSLRGDHVDLVQLDLRRLGRVAELIAEAVGNGNHKRLTNKKVVDIVVQAVKDDLVAVEDLEARVQQEVRKVLDGQK
jgi:hypothetical protein